MVVVVVIIFEDEDEDEVVDDDDDDDGEDPFPNALFVAFRLLPPFALPFRPEDLRV